MSRLQSMAGPYTRPWRRPLPASGWKAGCATAGPGTTHCAGRQRSSTPTRSLPPARVDVRLYHQPPARQPAGPIERRYQSQDWTRPFPLDGRRRRCRQRSYTPFQPSRRPPVKAHCPAGCPRPGSQLALFADTAITPSLADRDGESLELEADIAATGSRTHVIATSISLRRRAEPHAVGALQWSHGAWLAVQVPGA